MTIGLFAGRHALGHDGRYRPPSAPICWCGNRACPPDEPHRTGRRPGMGEPRIRPWSAAWFGRVAPADPPAATDRPAEPPVLSFADACVWLGRSREWLVEAIARGILTPAGTEADSIELDELRRWARGQAARGLIP